MKSDDDDVVGGLARELAPDSIAWTPWAAVPTSGFQVDMADGHARLVQVSATDFAVLSGFRYVHPEVKAMLISKVTPSPGKTAEETVELACTWTGNPDVTKAGRTDFASIPQPLRWFENTYGRHTLAAIIHDALIVDDKNGGALNSDALSDRFFREMLGTSGVALVKRWVLWAGVAIRSRWAAGGYRRLLIGLWVLAALFGILCGGGVVVALLGGPHLFGFSTVVLTAIAVGLPFLAAPMWGQQWGGSLVAALVGLWILPPTLVASAAYVPYKVTELVASKRGKAV